MKISARFSTLFLSAAAILGAAAPGFANAGYAPPSASPSRQSASPSGQILQPAPPSAPVVGPDAPIQLAASALGYRDGAYAGASVDAYYGIVQVRANIQHGRLASVEVLQYPADRRTSRRINDEALPILESEAISAQSARVDIVSGATLTSKAYLRSLNSALGQAGS
jgi:uncharacterized protein with FMN-binding domain